MDEQQREKLVAAVNRWDEIWRERNADLLAIAPEAEAYVRAAVQTTFAQEGGRFTDAVFEAADVATAQVRAAAGLEAVPDHAKQQETAKLQEESAARQQRAEEYDLEQAVGIYEVAEETLKTSKHPVTEEAAINEATKVYDPTTGRMVDPENVVKLESDPEYEERMRRIREAADINKQVARNPKSPAQHYAPDPQEEFRKQWKKDEEK